MDTLTHATEEAAYGDFSPAQPSPVAIVEPRQEPAPLGHEAPLLALISRAASDPRVDMDKFERLLAMQEKLEARAAQIAFNSALADAKSEIEPIVRNATGHNDKKFADLSAISKAVDHILAKNGLTYRWRTNQPGPISVTCIVSHKDGHSEENTLSGPPDKTGNKNDVQAIGSTQKYLMRYTLEGALGLSTTNGDDGRAASGNAARAISDEQVAEIEKLIDETESETTGMLKYVGAASIEGMTEAQFVKARAVLVRKPKKVAAA